MLALSSLDKNGVMLFQTLSQTFYSVNFGQPATVNSLHSNEQD